MKKTILALLLASSMCYGQNIIQNPCFDTINPIPTTLQQWMAPFPAKHWNEWGSADIFCDLSSWPVNTNANTFGFVTGYNHGYAGMITRLFGGFMPWEIIKTEAQVNGWCRVGASFYRAPYGTASSSMLMVLGDSLETPIFTLSAWVHWDTVVFITADSLYITAGPTSTGSTDGYIYIDSVSIIPLGPLALPPVKEEYHERQRGVPAGLNLRTFQIERLRYGETYLVDGKKIKVTK